MPDPLKLDSLRTVRQLAAASPFSEAQIRWWLFNRAENGLDRAVFRIGRRLYIEETEFRRWIERNREKGRQNADVTE